MNESIEATRSSASQHTDATPSELYELGAQRLAAGDALGAIEAYRSCLSRHDPHAGLYNNLGTALIRAGRYEEAIATLQTALSLQPEYPRAAVNLCKALTETGKFDAAIASIRPTLVRQPNYVPALINLGAAYAAKGELDVAADHLRRAVEFEPHHVEGLASLGMVALWRGEATEAIATLGRALKLAPNHADAHANLAHALFVTGDWVSAWPHFEFRFQRHAHRTPLRAPVDAARWDGQIGAGTVRLIGEQGLGDQLQFARYAKILQEAGQPCVLKCDRRLVRLLSRGLNAEVEPFEADVAPGTPWMPLMSLPQWHGTAPESAPLGHSYLRAESNKLAAWRALLPAGPKVALAWAGNPQVESGLYAGRSPPFESLAPLFAIDGVTFISLQREFGEAELRTLPNAARMTHYPGLDAGSDAFVDTAAILSSVDLLVTSDTALAHLGGALGAPTWVCLKKEPDWRWMRSGTTTPWYNSARIFRQTAHDDWRDVYERVAAALRRYFAA